MDQYYAVMIALPVTSDEFDPTRSRTGVDRQTRRDNVESNIIEHEAHRLENILSVNRISVGMDLFKAVYELRDMHSYSILLKYLAGQLRLEIDDYTDFETVKSRIDQLGNMLYSQRLGIPNSSSENEIIATIERLASEEIEIQIRKAGYEPSSDEDKAILYLALRMGIKNPLDYQRNLQYLLENGFNHTQIPWQEYEVLSCVLELELRGDQNMRRELFGINHRPWGMFGTENRPLLCTT